MKIAAKVLIIVIVVASITIATVGFFAFTTTKTALQDLSRHEQSEFARAVMDVIDRSLYERIHDIKSIAVERSFIDFLKNGGDVKPIESSMNQLLSMSGPWDFMFVADANGTIVLSTEIEEVEAKKNVRSEPRNAIAFDAAVSSGAYYSNAGISDDTGKESVIFAAPIIDDKDPQRKVLGVVIADYSMSVITDILKESSSTSDLDLYDRNGVFIATNSPAPTGRLYEKNEAAARLIKEFLAHPGGEGAALLTAEPEGKSDTLNTHAISDGFQEYHGNQWVLFVETPAEVALSPATHTARDIVMFILFMLVLANVLILALLGRLVIQPIADLTQTIEVFARGMLGERVNVRSKDELGQLAAAFNTMSTRLQASFKSLSLEQGKTRAIIESIGEGVMAIDAKGKVLLCNKAAAHLTGCDSSGSIDRPFKEVVKFSRNEVRGAAGALADSIMRGRVKKTSGNRAVIVRADGHETAVSISAAPMVDAEGRVQGSIVLIRSADDGRRS